MDHSDSHPHVKYSLIFAALCICTAISWALDEFTFLNLTPIVLVVAVLVVAVAKASFVMTYFMHLKFEGRWKFIVLAPTSILAVGLMIALAPDMAMHYYDYDVMQSQLDPDTIHRGGHGEGHGGDHADTHADEGSHDTHGGGGGDHH